MEPDMSTRKMFERYLYDYLVKRKMHQIAEVFRNEANLELDPSVALSNAMDPPEGFLQEWWSLNYDSNTFRAWMQMKEQHGISNASQEEICSLDEEALIQLPDNLTPNEAFNIGSNARPSHATGELPLIFLPSPNREVSGELPQLVLQSSHEKELPISTIGPVNVAHTNGPKDKSVIQNTPTAEYTGFTKETDPVLEGLVRTFWLFEEDQPSLFDKPIVGESSRNMENSLAHEEENAGTNEFTRSPPAFQNDDNNETSDDSNNFLITIDEDTSIAHQLESNEES